MESPKQFAVCRTSPAALGYWLAVGGLAWTGLSIVGFFWPPLAAGSAPTILSAMSVGCILNWRKNRTCHCGFTAPMLFLAASVFLLSELGVVAVPSSIVWVALGLGIGLAFWWEWRMTRRAYSN